MDKKIISIIIILLLATVAGGSYYYYINSGPQYKNITMNGITMEVPESNITVTQQTDIYSFYNDSDNNIEIFVLDSTTFGLNDFSEAVTYAALREAFQVGASLQTSDGYSYNYSESSGIYSWVGNYSHKNLLIATNSKEDMIHILESVKVDENSSSLNESNETNVTQSKTTTKKTQSVEEEDSEREDEQVIDGWDPKEHEVSREKMDDGYERVDYDDGYYRIVDKKGNVESYGY